MTPKSKVPRIDDLVHTLRQRDGHGAESFFLLSLALGASLANGALDEPSDKIGRLTKRLQKQALQAARRERTRLRLVKKKTPKE